MGTKEAQHKTSPDPSSSQSAYQSSGMSFHPLCNSALSTPTGRSDAPLGTFMPSTLPPGSCPMCYNPNVDVVLAPCHHQFHAGCIDRALTQDKVCPMCWMPIQASRRVLQQQYAAQMQARIHQGTDYIVDHKAQGGDGRAHNAPSEETSTASAKPQTTVMRKGKWTAEESAYCDRLIDEFKKGNLPLAEGTTLRTFLSKLLHCDPMRISKKYTGDQCIGKIIFRRRDDDVSSDMESIRTELAELEKTYLEREQYNLRRREKRLESELSRDKSRFETARSVGYAAAGNPSAMKSPHLPHQHQPGYLATTLMPKHEPRPVQQPVTSGYGGPSRPNGLPVQPPLHPPQLQSHTPVAAHFFNNDPTNVSMLGIASTQPPGQGQQVPTHVLEHKPSNGATIDGNLNDAFPRVSSIDSFSCLFPRVASIENFQHTTSSSFGGMHLNASFAMAESMNTMSSSGYDFHSLELPKPLSISEGLNAYFPRIQSYEQLSDLLQDHGPNSPRAAQTSRDLMENTNTQQLEKENFAPTGVRQQLGECSIKEEQQQDTDMDRRTTSEPHNTNDSSVSKSTSSEGTKRLSPSHNVLATSGSGNQIQAPKPVNKMPRSSSGIFPRVPSMDNMPCVPSMDKIPRVASLDKLPRIPSMDKLHTLSNGEQRIPRVPSTDKMSRVPSSDMLSRFGSGDLSSFPSFSNLSTLSSSASHDKLSSLGGFKSGFPRNSSIEDILSLVASSESTGLASTGTAMQLNALAAVAGEESLHFKQKRRLEKSQLETSLTGDHKKSKLSV